MRAFVTGAVWHLKQAALGCGLIVVSGVLLLALGDVVTAHLSAPGPPPDQPTAAERHLAADNQHLRRRVSGLEASEARLVAENLALRGDLDALRRGAVWVPAAPEPAPEDRIPKQTLPTAPKE